MHDAALGAGQADVSQTRSAALRTDVNDGVTLLGKPSAVRRGLSGMTTVFVPSAPTPAGSIDDLTEARFKLLDVPVSAALG